MPQKRLKITSYHKSAAVTSSALSTDPNNHDAPAEGASSSSSSKTGFQIRMTSFYLIPTTELKKIVTGNYSSSSGSTCSNVGEKRSHFQQQTTHTSSSTIKATRRATSASSSSTTNHDNALSNISDTFLKSSRVNSTADHSSRRSHSPCSSTADPNNGDDVHHTSSFPLLSNTNNFRTTGGTTATTTSIIGCEENSRSTDSDLADSTIAQVVDYNIGGKTSRSTDAELANSTISQAVDTWEDHGMTNNRKYLARTPYIVKDHVDGQTVMNSSRRFYQDPVLNFQYPAHNSHNYIAPLSKPSNLNVFNHSNHCNETKKFLAKIKPKKTTKKIATTQKIATTKKIATTQKIAKMRSADIGIVYNSLKEFQADIPEKESLPEKSHMPLQDGHPLIPLKTDSDPYERQIHRALKLQGTRFHFLVMSNLEIATMKSGDIRGKRINSMPVGYHGMMCRYCHGATRQFTTSSSGLGRSGRYFPLSLKTLADAQKTLGSIYNHLLSCPDVPDKMKRAVAASKAFQVDDKNHLPRGSQQKFYRILWKRLHGIKDFNADTPGPGTQREWVKGRSKR